MRVTLDSESPTIISVWRDSAPLPGEKPIGRVLVSSNARYHSRKRPEVVADFAHFSLPRLQKFLVERTPEADRLVAALRQGPITPTYVGVGEITIDVDRIKRADVHAAHH